MTLRSTEPTTLPLSVVVGTTQPWPEVRPCLDGFYAEARAIGAEVLVAHRGDGLPADVASSYPGVVAVCEPDASIYRLRSIGMARSRGDVVLLTEDHCVPRAGWCRAHLEAHRRRPDVAVVGGPVLNGATRRLIDWASFLLGHASYLPPIEPGERPAVDRSNVSYKRRVLPAEPSPDGRMEPVLDSELQARGEKFLMQPDPLIDHVQSLGLRGTLSIHFHNGRAVAGLRLMRGVSALERAARVVASLLVAPAFFGRTLRAAYGCRPLPTRAIASLPLLGLITSVVAAGFVTGYVAGAGDSPRHIR